MPAKRVIATGGIAELDGAAMDLLGLGTKAAVLKGGHLSGDKVVDVLAQPGAPLVHMRSGRIASRSVHGTGCTLSSAIACHLALGLDLAQSVAEARSYILHAIAAGAHVRTGKGHGPLNHGHAPVAMRILLAP